MKLVPSNLGERWGNTVIRQRGGALTREEERRQNLQQAAGSCAAVAVTSSFTGQSWLFSTVSGLIAGGIVGLALPRLRRRQVHETPLSAQELARLRPEKTYVASASVLDTIFSTLLGQPLPQATQKHTLEDAYFDLIADALPLEVASLEAEAQLRTAIESLGNAVASLPATAPVDESEISDLVADAETLLIRSKREKDPIIAESLHRQAEAAVRRARALQNAARIARRTRTLRDEVYSQIGALRASLPAFSQVSQSITTGRIQEMAESVSKVAQDAASVVAAQEELVQTLAPEWRVRTSVEETAPLVQRLRR